MDQRHIRHKTLRKNVREKLQDIGFDDDILDMTPNTQAKKKN